MKNTLMPSTHQCLKSESLTGSKPIEPMMKQPKFRRLFDRHTGIVPR